MGKHVDDSRAADTRDDYSGQHRAEDNPGGWRGGSVGDQSGQRAGAGDRGEAGHGDTPNR